MTTALTLVATAATAPARAVCIGGTPLVSLPTLCGASTDWVSTS